MPETLTEYMQKEMQKEAFWFLPALGTAISLGVGAYDLIANQRLQKMQDSLKDGAYGEAAKQGITSLLDVVPFGGSTMAVGRFLRGRGIASALKAPREALRSSRTAYNAAKLDPATTPASLSTLEAQRKQSLDALRAAKAPYSKTPFWAKSKNINATTSSMFIPQGIAAFGTDMTSRYNQPPAEEVQQAPAQQGFDWNAIKKHISDNSDVYGTAAGALLGGSLFNGLTDGSAMGSLVGAAGGAGLGYALNQYLRDYINQQQKQ
jgi:outer membrane lipoprotein SlyB